MNFLTLLTIVADSSRQYDECVIRFSLTELSYLCKFFVLIVYLTTMLMISIIIFSLYIDKVGRY